MARRNTSPLARTTKVMRSSARAMVSPITVRSITHPMTMTAHSEQAQARPKSIRKKPYREREADSPTSKAKQTTFMCALAGRAIQEQRERDCATLARQAQLHNVPDVSLAARSRRILKTPLPSKSFIAVSGRIVNVSLIVLEAELKRRYDAFVSNVEPTNGRDVRMLIDLSGGCSRRTWAAQRSSAAHGEWPPDLLIIGGLVSAGLPIA